MRGTLLMGLSNQHGHLLLATSNKSEVAVGYSTLYGDAAGGFAPIKDVPKTLVWELARWRNEEARRRGETEPIPQNSIDKPPSAELAPGQQDSDSLPSYEELDAVVADYVDRDLGMADLLERGHDPEVVARVSGWWTWPSSSAGSPRPGTKISLKAFGRDRRLPITNRWRESLPSVREGAATCMSESVALRRTSSARVRVHHLLQAKERGEKWAMLTAYDTVQRLGLRGGRHPGDAGRRLRGQRRPRARQTVPVTVDDILFMTRAVTRSTKRALIVADMPFGSYEAGPSRRWPPPSGS